LKILKFYIFLSFHLYLQFLGRYGPKMKVFKMFKLLIPVMLYSQLTKEKKVIFHQILKCPHFLDFEEILQLETIKNFQKNHFNGSSSKFVCTFCKFHA